MLSALIFHHTSKNIDFWAECCVSVSVMAGVSWLLTTVGLGVTVLLGICASSGRDKVLNAWSLVYAVASVT